MIFCKINQNKVYHKKYSKFWVCSAIALKSDTGVMITKIITKKPKQAAHKASSDGKAQQLSLGHVQRSSPKTIQAAHS